MQRIATDDTAQAVSISWGICEAISDHADETPIFEQLAAGFIGTTIQDVSAFVVIMFALIFLPTGILGVRGTRKI